MPAMSSEQFSTFATTPVVLAEDVFFLNFFLVDRVNPSVPKCRARMPPLATVCGRQVAGPRARAQRLTKLPPEKIPFHPFIHHCCMKLLCAALRPRAIQSTVVRALSSDSFFISRNSKSQPVQVSRSSISQSRERVLSGIQPTGVPHIGAPPAPALPALIADSSCRQLLRRSQAMGLASVRRAGLRA